jgi:peptidyl-prolyl cis-trans isomerase D
VISWIQKYFQHHFRTIFAVMLGLLIISFVFTIGPSGLGRGSSLRTIQRQFFGYNLNSQEDAQRLMGDAQISASLQMGSLAGVDPQQLQSYALQRAASLHLADEWHIPASTDAEITDFIKGLGAFHGATGQFDGTAYQNFRNSLKANPNITEAAIKDVLADDVRAQKVQKLVAGPGYVLPNDVKLQLKRSDTAWTVATATTEYAAFAPEIKPTEADLTKFFEDNAFRYEIPPRVVASSVNFPSANFLASVTVNDAEVRAYYDANPARFPKPAAATPAAPATPALPADANADFAAVRPQVEAALKAERAQILALRAASDFVLSIYNGKVTQGPALEALLAAARLTAQPLAPFSREQGPAELGGSPEIADAGFRLDKDRYYSDPLPTPNGAAVLLWKEILPSQKPAFANVRAKVATDYVENEKRKRFVELGHTLRPQIETRLKAGDNFEKAIAALPANNGVKFQVKSLPAFTARTRPQDLDFSVLDALENLEKGQVSELAVSADKGAFVYVIEKMAPDLSEANPEYLTMRNQLGQFSSRLASGAVISEIVDRELKRSEPKVQ